MACGALALAVLISVHGLSAPTMVRGRALSPDPGHAGASGCAVRPPVSRLCGRLVISARSVRAPWAGRRPPSSRACWSPACSAASMARVNRPSTRGRPSSPTASRTAPTRGKPTRTSPLVAGSFQARASSPGSSFAQALSEFRRHPATLVASCANGAARVVEKNAKVLAGIVNVTRIPNAFRDPARAEGSRLARRVAPGRVVRLFRGPDMAERTACLLAGGGGGDGGLRRVRGKRQPDSRSGDGASADGAGSLAGVGSAPDPMACRGPEARPPPSNGSPCASPSRSGPRWPCWR